MAREDAKHSFFSSLRLRKILSPGFVFSSFVIPDGVEVSRNYFVFTLKSTEDWLILCPSLSSMVKSSV